MGFNTHQWYLNGLKKTGAANTLIGGVASIINTPDLLAAKLRNYPSGTAFSAANIQNFTIVGDDIECYIEVDYQIVNSAFFNNNLITQYRSLGNFCKLTNTSSFANCSNLTYLYFNDAIILGAAAQLSGNNLIIEAKNCIKVLYGFVNGVSGAAKISYLPNCNSFGDMVGNDNVFINIYASLSDKKYYLSPFLQTSNAGAEEGDVAYARSMGANISYVQNFTAPNPITNLSIGNIYGGTIQLIDNGASANAIDYYEKIKINGVDYPNVNVGSYITGLTPNTSYNIEATAVDIFYNKSTSNIVTQATATTYYVDTASLVSYYKMEGNVLDSWGANNGTPTAITYVSGLVGQAISLNGTTSFVDLNSTSIIGGKAAFSLVILFKNLGKTSNNILYGSFLAGSTKIIVRINTGQIQFYTVTTAQAGGNFFTFSDTASFHILECTYDGTTMRAYLDGAESINTYSQTGSINSGGETEKIGKERTNFGNAIIDEVSIFNKALSAGEVSEINAKLNSGQSLI